MVFFFLTSLHISDIQHVKGFRFENWYILGRTRKSNGNFKILRNLDPRVDIILKRYDFNFQLFTDVEYNRWVKILLKLFFEKHELYPDPITIIRFKYQPEPIVTTYRFYELYTSYCNRCGWLSHFSSMFEDRTLMEIMGTKSHAEFLKYKKNNVYHLIQKG